MGTNLKLGGSPPPVDQGLLDAIDAITYGRPYEYCRCRRCCLLLLCVVCCVLCVVCCGCVCLVDWVVALFSLGGFPATADATWQSAKALILFRPGGCDDRTWCAVSTHPPEHGLLLDTYARVCRDVPGSVAVIGRPRDGCRWRCCVAQSESMCWHA